MNMTILSGNLGKDPELRKTTSGKSVCSFSVATSNGKDRPSDWHNVICWDKTAELCANNLKKGSKIAIEGKSQTRSYEKDGQTIYKTEVVAYRVEFLSPKIQRQEPQPSFPVSDQPPIDENQNIDESGLPF